MLAKVFFRKVPSIARRQQPIFQLLGRLVSNHSYTFKKASRQVERRSLTWNERQLFSNSSHKWEIEHHKCKQKKASWKSHLVALFFFCEKSNVFLKTRPQCLKIIHVLKNWENYKKLCSTKWVFSDTFQAVWRARGNLTLCFKKKR